MWVVWNDDNEFVRKPVEDLQVDDKVEFNILISISNPGNRVVIEIRMLCGRIVERFLED